jgi:hypothetical protein
MFDKIKLLREVHQTPDGKVFGTRAEAENHVGMTMRINSVGRVRDTLKQYASAYRRLYSRVPASEVADILAKNGWVYDPNLDKGGE